MAAPQSPTPIRPLHVLVVEDHGDTLDMLRRVVERCGCSVVAARSVASAKEAAAANTHFDLLISDIGLPDGSGADVLQHVRSHQPDIAAIALTGFATDQFTQSAGFTAHLTKPVDLAALRALIAGIAAK